MSLIENICQFFSYIVSYFTDNSITKQSAEENSLEGNASEEIFEQSSEESMHTDVAKSSSAQAGQEAIQSEEEDKISVAKRTLMTKLYILEQEIAVFENDFPEEYKSFMERIKSLRELYNSSLEEVEKLLTFEIDPDSDPSKISEVIRLEMDIRMFIEKEVKFNIISQRLQRLITKLNILYNVSIVHFSEEEKKKVMSQLGHALDSETRIVKEFKRCDYVLNNKQLEERIINLISYLDYEIFKISIRNSDETPRNIINNLVMVVEFDKFDYMGDFKAFIKDEISDLGELLHLINDEACRIAFKKKYDSLVSTITYSNEEDYILDVDFWNSYLNFESSFIGILRDSGVDKEKAKIGLIINMNICVKEKEVMTLPITNTYLSLTSVYAITHDVKILLLIKLLKNVSNEITYKEIYFLILLFDVMETIKRVPNELIRYMEKYISKYPYDRKTVISKKKSVIGSSNKEYVVIFKLDNYEKEIVNALNQLNFDYKVMGENVYMNSFYFNGLENVISSLKSNTANTTI